MHVDAARASSAVPTPVAVVACLAAPAAADIGSAVAWGQPRGIANYPGGIFKQIDGGLEWSIGLRHDGTIEYWGSPVTPLIPWWLLQEVPENDPSNPFVAIAAGRTHALALRADGTVVGWGDDWPIDEPPIDPPPGVRFRAIAAGENFSMGIVDSTDPAEDGTLRMWGWNYSFQHPGLDPPPLYDGKVRAIAAGGHHALLIKEDGTLHAWGEHHASMHHFGQGSVPPELQNIQARDIAAGHHHNLVLAEDGRVYAWGLDSHGQAVSRPASERFVAIAAGYAFNMAIDNSGQVIIWGANEYDVHDIPPIHPEAVDIVSGGYYHAYAVQGCYANCDGRVDEPIYSVDDFICFVDRFAEGDLWANCTGATSSPYLTVDDFVCFIDRFTSCPGS